MGRDHLQPGAAVTRDLCGTEAFDDYMDFARAGPAGPQRRSRNAKDGKVHRYWRLVQSVRVGRRLIQQTVAQLGELDAEGRLHSIANRTTSSCRCKPKDKFA